MTALDAFLPRAPDWRLDWDGLDAAFPWIRRLRGCPQDPVHHAEGDVWIHTRMVAEALAGLPEWRGLAELDRLATFAAVLLHDVAKPDCTRTEGDGRITARGHSRRGAVMARAILWRLGLPFGTREQAVAIIARHQIPFFLVDRPDARRLALEASLTTGCAPLALVAEADARGRIAADRPRLLDAIALFRDYAAELGCLDRPFPFPSDHTRFTYFRDPEGRAPDLPAYDDRVGEAVLMSGLPGAGKDTWIAGNAAGRPVVSLDALRRTLGVAPEAPQGPVIAAARAAAREHLRARRPFVWNATNLSRSLRDGLAGLCTDYRARLRMVYVEAPEPVLRARNQSRPEPVPEAAIERMLRRWEIPDLTECHALATVITG